MDTPPDDPGRTLANIRVAPSTGDVYSCPHRGDTLTRSLSFPGFPLAYPKYAMVETLSALPSSRFSLMIGQGAVNRGNYSRTHRYQAGAEEAEDGDEEHCRGALVRAERGAPAYYSSG